MLLLVTAAREANIEMHLQPERELLKIVFAFYHINYDRYNSFQHMLFSQEQRLNSRAYRDLLLNGHTASTIGNKFSGVSGDLITECFNKKTKESAGPFRGGYSTQMSTINTWVRNCHIRVKVKTKLKEILKLHASFMHKELTPGGKKRHVKHVSSLKDTLRNRVNVFDDGAARCISTAEEINGNVIKGLLESKDVGAAQFEKFTDHW